MRAYGAVFGVLWCGGLIVNIIGPVVGGSWLAIPVGLVMMGGGLFFIVRMNRLALIAEDDVLIVRNLYRTRRIPRSAIQGFRTGNPGMMMPFGRTIHVLVADDSVVTAEVFMSSGFTRRGRRRLDERLSPLREWLSQSG